MVPEGAKECGFVGCRTGIVVDSSIFERDGPQSRREQGNAPLKHAFVRRSVVKGKCPIGKTPGSRLFQPEQYCSDMGCNLLMPRTNV